MSNSTIIQNLQTAINLKKEIIENKEMQTTINQIHEAMVNCLKNGGKILFCGNGGSAADAQHLSAELSGRYYFDRPPLFAEALHVNTSYLTAIANDFSYEEVYARLTVAMGKPGDVLIGLSTSGNSTNVVQAMKKANSIGMVTIGFTGQGGGRMKQDCNYTIEINSKDTPRIQECHMHIGHTLCQLVERDMFPDYAPQ